MEGLEASLGRKAQENRYRKVTGDVEARICTIACSKPPEGASRWTMQAIADELIRLEVVDYITDSTICEVMKKNEIKPWLVKEWCIPEADADFVAKMEDVLEVYQRPYDPLRPVVCIDETNKQLRTCIHRRGMPDGRGVLPSCKAKNRRNTWCISRFFNAAGRQKTRPDGVQRL